MNHILINEKVEEFAALGSLDGPVYPRNGFSPFGFSSMPRKFITWSCCWSCWWHGWSSYFAGTATGLAGASKFLLEVEDTGCTYAQSFVCHFHSRIGGQHPKLKGLNHPENKTWP